MSETNVEEITDELTASIDAVERSLFALYLACEAPVADSIGEKVRFMMSAYADKMDSIENQFASFVDTMNTTLAEKRGDFERLHAKYMATQAEAERMRVVISDLQRGPVCGVCAGDPSSVVGPCVCGGSGREVDEVLGLRQALQIAERQRDEAMRREVAFCGLARQQTFAAQERADLADSKYKQVQAINDTIMDDYREANSGTRAYVKLKAALKGAEKTIARRTEHRDLLSAALARVISTYEKYMGLSHQDEIDDAEGIWSRMKD